jgi:hypothetical protein
MALFIIREGQKITGYGKSGEIEISSYPSINGQPASKDQVYWDGSQVKLKSEQMLANDLIEERAKELSELISVQWINSTRNVTQIKEQYDLLRLQSSTWSTRDQVNTEFDNFITWLDYE